MRKNPYRENHAISQTFNDGFAVIYTVTDAARPGYAPQEAIAPKIRVDYAERRVGVQRFYAAAQNNVRIDRLIRIPRVDCVSTQDVLIFGGESVQYRIDQVQTVENCYPPSLDVSLVRIEQEFTYAEGGGGSAVV